MGSLRQPLSLALLLAAGVGTACVNSGRRPGPLTPGRAKWVEQRISAVRGIAAPTEKPAPSLSWQSFVAASKESVSDETATRRWRADRALGFVAKNAEPPKTGVAFGALGAVAAYDAKSNSIALLGDLEVGRPTESAYGHEFTHYLDDSKFDIWNLRLAAKGNSDRSIAVQSLIEGSALLTQVDYALSESYEDSHSGIGSVQISRTVDDLESELGLMSRVPNPQMLEALLRSPKHLRERVVFPYSRGLLLARALHERRGAASLDEAFANPPRSTEQVLHPERLLDRRDDPAEVELATEGWPGEVIFEDTLGELGVRQWFETSLRRHEASPLADGWGGDRFRVLSGAAGDVLCWVSEWDSEREAEEFAQGADALLCSRYGDSPCWMQQFGFDDVKRPDGRYAQIRRRGRAVAIVDPAPDTENDWAERLLDESRITRTTPLPSRPSLLEAIASPLFRRREHADGSGVRVLGGLLATHDRHAESSSFSLLGGTLLDTASSPDGGRVSLLFGLISWRTAPRLESGRVRVGPFAHGHDAESVSWSALPIVDAPAYTRSMGRRRVRLGVWNFDEAYAVEFNGAGKPSEKAQIQGGTSLGLGLLGREWVDSPEADGTPFRRTKWYFPFEIGFSIDGFEYGPLGPSHQPPPQTASRPRGGLLPGDVVEGTQIQMLGELIFSLDSRAAYRRGEELQSEASWKAGGGLLGAGGGRGEDTFWATPLVGWGSHQGRSYLLLLWGAIAIPIAGDGPASRPSDAPSSEPASR
ncbi:MAG: hypothetical protein JNJ88_02325 [Planctomycetes bacterium]|nr:hypothetical protein [Planctomycetota bacterium]